MNAKDRDGKRVRRMVRRVYNPDASIHRLTSTARDIKRKLKSLTTNVCEKVFILTMLLFVESKDY